MSTDTLERPKTHPPKRATAVPPTLPQSIFNIDAIQAYVDSIQAPENDEGQRKPLPLPSVIPGITPMLDEPDAEGRPQQMPCCKLDDSGQVVPGTGAIVLEEFVAKMEEMLRPKIAQQVHRTHQIMSYSLQRDGTGKVAKAAQILLPIPESEW